MIDGKQQLTRLKALPANDPCLSGLHHENLSNLESLESSAYECILALARLIGYDEVSDLLYPPRRPAATHRSRFGSLRSSAS